MRTLPVLDEPYEDIQHPYTDFSLGQTIALAVNNAKAFFRKEPKNLQEVRDYFQDQITRVGHQWITGYAALDLLDAAIDGKDIRKNSRLL